MGWIEKNKNVVVVAFVVMAIIFGISMQSVIQISPYTDVAVGMSLAKSTFTQGSQMIFYNWITAKQFSPLAFTNNYCDVDGTYYKQIYFKMVTYIQDQVFIDYFHGNCGEMAQTYDYKSAHHTVTFTKTGTQTIRQVITTDSGKSIGMIVFDEKYTYIVNEATPTTASIVCTNPASGGSGQITATTTTGERKFVNCPAKCRDLDASKASLPIEEIKALGCVAECTAGQTKCAQESVAYYTCVSGEWSKQYCPTIAYICSSGSCVLRSTPPPPVCKEGATYCKNAGQIITCVNNDYTTTNCPSDQMCYTDLLNTELVKQGIQGRCIKILTPTTPDITPDTTTPVCTDEFYCVDSSEYKHCVDGQYVSETCPAYTVCEVDICISKETLCPITASSCKAGTKFDSIACACVPIPADEFNLDRIILALGGIGIVGIAFIAVLVSAYMVFKNKKKR